MESLNINRNLCHNEAGNTVLFSIGKFFMQDNQRQTHWAYVAGVMDSDGSFYLSKNTRKTTRIKGKKGTIYPTNVEGWRPSYRPSVQICQIEPEAVFFLKDEMKLGYVYSDGIRKSRPNRAPMFRWFIKGRENLIYFLENVIPFLTIKKKRAEFLLSYCKHVQDVNDQGNLRPYFGLDEEELAYREDAYIKMREFNRKKVAASTKPRKYESISDSQALQETVRVESEAV